RARRFNRLRSRPVFFVRTSRRAMVVVVTRARYDQCDKQMIREALEGHYFVETDAEAPADTRRIDLWATPRAADAPPLDHLGLPGQIAGGPVTFEFFHNTPSGTELATCLIKHGEFRHSLSRRRTPPPLPIQWVISSGRPDAGIAGLAFRPMPGGLRGIYES